MRNVTIHTPAEALSIHESISGIESSLQNINALVHYGCSQHTPTFEGEVYTELSHDTIMLPHPALSLRRNTLRIKDVNVSDHTDDEQLESLEDDQYSITFDFINHWYLNGGSNQNSKIFHLDNCLKISKDPVFKNEFIFNPIQTLHIKRNNKFFDYTGSGSRVSLAEFYNVFVDQLGSIPYQILQNARIAQLAINAWKNIPDGRKTNFFDMFNQNDQGSSYTIFTTERILPLNKLGTVIVLLGDMLNFEKNIRNSITKDTIIPKIQNSKMKIECFIEDNPMTEVSPCDIVATLDVESFGRASVIARLNRPACRLVDRDGSSPTSNRLLYATLEL